MKKILFSLIILIGVCLYFARSCNNNEDTISITAELDEDDSELTAWEEADICNRQFIKDVKSNPSLLDSQTEDLFKSDDGNLIIYYWDDGTGYSTVSWANIVKYKYKGKEYVTYFLDTSESTPESELSPLSGCIESLNSLKAKDGRVVYMVGEFYRYAGCHACEWIDLLEIKDGDLVEIDKSNNGVYDLGVHIDVDICDWGDNRYGINEEWSGYFKFDKHTQVLYVPEVENQIMTGRYIKHHFNGKEMIPEGVTCSYGLHSSVKDFKFMECVFDTKGFRVRVDRMPNGDYRYSSWKSGVSMSTKPDLIIYKGSRDFRNEFEFDNNGYIYRVAPQKNLIVIHNDKVIVNQEKIES